MHQYDESRVVSLSLDEVTERVTALLASRHPCVAVAEGELWLCTPRPPQPDCDWMQIGTRWLPNRAAFWLALYRASQLEPEPDRPTYLDTARRCRDYTHELEQRVLHVGRSPIYKMVAHHHSRQLAQLSWR